MSNLRFCWDGPGHNAIPAEQRAGKISRYGMNVPRIEKNLRIMREQLASIRNFKGDDQDAYELIESFRDTVREITRCVPNHVVNYTRMLQWCSYILHETDGWSYGLVVGDENEILNSAEMLHDFIVWKWGLDG